MVLDFRYRHETCGVDNGELETMEILSNERLMLELCESLKDFYEGRYRVFNSLEDAFKWLNTER